jgi:hypothetical protein
MKKAITTSKGNVYEFINESWSTSRSWGHKTRLYINNNYVDDNKVSYLNRTWESYQYQSCMQDLIDKRIKNTLTDAINDYKALHNIKRLNKELRGRVEVKFKEDNSELYEVLDKL